MADFVVKVDEKTFGSLASINHALGEFSKKGIKSLTEDDHASIGKLLNKKAEILSGALGKKIHSICD